MSVNDENRWFLRRKKLAQLSCQFQTVENELIINLKLN